MYESLLCAAAVRERCGRIGELAQAGQANWFSINQGNFQRAVALVRQNCLKNYPDLKIPLHSRWRHFEMGETGLWQHYTRGFNGGNVELARSGIDLVFLSVLLDAGAGGQWQYQCPVTAARLSRSEGLAAASVDLFFNHVARFEPARGWIMDAECLYQLTQKKLCAAMQHSHKNPLLGVEGRLSLLHGLADVLHARRTDGHLYSRPGNLVDECMAISKTPLGGKLSLDLTHVLVMVLKNFSTMWPGGHIHNGVNLGDCGYHSLIATEDATSGIIPFHKLSQWLTYSMIEPLKWAGIEVTDLDGLTGLPEYRNGGLFVDTGALQPLDVNLINSRLGLESEAVVEWRALTVFMLDQLAVAVRKSLQLSAKQLPLCAVLQGGTWATGRELAARLRPRAAPPFNLVTDGTVF